MLRFWLLRHGRSLADDERRIEGRYDSPLTEVGRKQAEERARHFESALEPFDRIVASPLLRARETAEIIGRHLGIKVELDERWMEVDNGSLAGLTFDEAKERFPKPAFVTPFHKLAGDGESAWETQSRAARALQALVENGSPRQLVVAHGGVLNAAGRVMVGHPPPTNRLGWNLRFGDNAYLQVLHDPETHRWSFERFEPGLD